MSAVDTPDAARFADLQRVLALVAQGLAGRHLNLEPVDHLERNGLERLTGTDGGTIRLPTAIAAFSAPDNVGAYRVGLLHQVTQLAAGTLDVDVDRLTASSDTPSLLRHVFGALEDGRITAAVRRHYPGARHDLDRVLAWARAGRPRPARLPLREALIEVIEQHALGAPAPGPLPHDPDDLRAVVVAAADALTAPEATVWDSVRLAVRVCSLLRSIPGGGEATDGDLIEITPIYSEDELDGAAGGGSIDDDAEVDARPPATEPDGSGLEFHGLLEADTVLDRSGQGLTGTTPEQIRGWLQAVDVGAEEDDDERDRAARRPAPERTIEADRSFFYDEWSYLTDEYLPAWCRLVEHRLRGDDHDFIARVRRQHADLVHRVRRRFSFVRPDSWQRVHTEDGDEFDLDAVISAIIDRRAGYVTDEHLYVRRERARREVAAAFLLDMSASTSSPVVEPEVVVDGPDEEEDLYRYYTVSVDPSARRPPERRVLDVAKDALALMCDALQILGDEHAVYGFSGDGREAVEFYVAKEFRDSPSTRTWAALAAMEPRRYTRMGPAIRHAMTKLHAQPARTKVLIVVSDGYPQDRDYGPNRDDSEYGLHDTAKALEEAERAGISTFCVTVDPAGHDYLRRMCAEDRYLVIDDVMALPHELTKVYRALTSVRSRAGDG